MEILFWKVIHNKFLFRYIIQIIHSTNWVYYTNHKQWSHENRMKFEYANKFECNQFISINQNSIISFFNLYSKLPSSSPPTLSSPNYTLKELDEILKLLLDKKRNQFEICDLTKLAITSLPRDAFTVDGYYNSGVFHLIRLLVCKPYSINLYPSTVKCIIEKCKTELLNVIFILSNNNENIIFGDEVRKNALELSSNNKRMKTLIIKSNFLTSTKPTPVKEFDSPLPLAKPIKLKEEKQTKTIVKKSRDSNNIIYKERKRNGNLESLKRYLNKKYIGSGQSIKLFHMGIKYCNVSLLKDIDSLDSKFKQCGDLKMQLKSNTTIGNLSNMVSYFVNNGKFKSFSTCLLKEFGKCVISFLSIHNIPFTQLPNQQDFNQLFNMVQYLIFDFTITKPQEFKYLVCNTSILSNDLRVNEKLVKIKYYLFQKNQDIYYFDIGINLDQMISVVLELINKFKSNGSSGTELETKNITRFINYYWDLIISNKNIQIDQLVQIYNTITDQSITLIHSLFHSFRYLLIRNSRFTRYIFSRPDISCSFVDFNAYYNADLSKRYYGNYYDFGNYLNVDLFTFDYIFSRDHGGYFINSFDTIIKQLIQQLSYSSFEDMSLLYEEFATTSLNYDLQFLIVMGKNDLFFKELEWISNKVEQGTQLDDSFPSLISTIDSPLFNSISNHCDNNNNGSIESNYIKSFKLQNNTIKMACMKMDLESIKRIVSINYNHHLFHQHIFEAATEFQRLDIISYILDNFIINFTCNYWISSIEINDYHVIELLFSNYYNILKQPYHLKLLESLDNILTSNENQELFNEFTLNPNSRIDILKSQLPNILNEFEYDYSKDQYKYNGMDHVKIKKLILCSIYNQDTEFQSFISNLKIDKFQDFDFFNISFKQGNIELCDLILKFYPNQYPTINSITSVLRENKIHVIKYYQNHSIFNQLQIDKIKSEMLNHLDYKYIK